MPLIADRAHERRPIDIAFCPISAGRVLVRPLTLLGADHLSGADAIAARELPAFLETASQLGLTVGRFSYITAKYLRQPRQ
jgi:hypothetical protein